MNQNTNSQTKDNVSTASAAKAFTKLFETIQALRAPDGCPWDREQTPYSMRGDLIEEVFEAVDAINEYNDNTDSVSHVKEELGDIMLNTIMVSYMFQQTKDFSVADVLNEVTEKIIRRHPHVFPDSAGKENAIEGTKTAADVLVQWDAIKRGIEGRSKLDCVLDEVSKGLPPLLRSYKIQKKAAKKGFDWDSIDPVKQKVLEEIEEVNQAQNEYFKAIANQSQDSINQYQAHLEEEFGDLLFAVVNWARHSEINPVLALERANNKFRNRFAYVQNKMEEENKPMESSSLEIMDTYWNEAKEAERNK